MMLFILPFCTAVIWTGNGAFSRKLVLWLHKSKFTLKSTTHLRSNFYHHLFIRSINVYFFLAGFRKIRKLEPSPKLGVLPFEPCGFLDPHIDPTEEDKRLWQVNDFQIHPEMTPETAKYVFKHASDEFCNMVFDELQVNNLSSGIMQSRSWPHNCNFFLDKYASSYLF